MIAKVIFITVILVYKHVSSTKCYSCEALDKHLPMSNCYFINNASSVTTFEEEYARYSTDQRGNSTVKGNVAHTVRSCAPSNLNDSCAVNSTEAVVRQCIICDSDLCNGTSRENILFLPLLTMLVLIVPILLAK
ncbi:hypothetical protein NQ317_005615 [Molorchus minor]|uniref:Protein sleepless n=1 Tax=Molorchus minor TaxID=1323400 RepID=A0ABQ9K6R0_9CUCU|nr:hypothetical protein NQ317_005615 [Molorchus minor]